MSRVDSCDNDCCENWDFGMYELLLKHFSTVEMMFSYLLLSFPFAYGYRRWMPFLSQLLNCNVKLIFQEDAELNSVFCVDYWLKSLLYRGSLRCRQIRRRFCRQLYCRQIRRRFWLQLNRRLLRRFCLQLNRPLPPAVLSLVVSVLQDLWWNRRRFCRQLYLWYKTCDENFLRIVDFVTETFWT